LHTISLPPFQGARGPEVLFEHGNHIGVVIDHIPHIIKESNRLFPICPTTLDYLLGSLDNLVMVRFDGKGRPEVNIQISVFV
jgi:hypothetical protein